MTTEYTTSDLTEGTVDGNGVYDILMRSQVAHLEKEFNAGRITGAEYSRVYESMMNATLTQSIQFLLSKDTSAAQADLTRAQEVSEIGRGGFR